MANVAARFALLQSRAKGPARFCWIAALRDGLLDMRFEFFVDLADQPIAASNVDKT